MVIEMRKQPKFNFDHVWQGLNNEAITELSDTDKIAIEIGKTGLHAFDASNQVYETIISAKKEAAENLKKSYTDELTGCFNRNYFEWYINEKFNPVYDNGKLGLVLIDLDNLKTVNDSLGHQAGDKFLQSAAELLKSTFRRQDDIYRIGGDEFAVICKNREADENFEIALNKKMETARQSSNVEFSFGTAVFNIDEDKDFGATKNRADILAYKDKENKEARRKSRQ
jgi:diguanylate cyclase (GGDEF)-like protein